MCRPVVSVFHGITASMAANKILTPLRSRRLVCDGLPERLGAVYENVLRTFESEQKQRG